MGVYVYLVKSKTITLASGTEVGQMAYGWKEPETWYEGKAKRLIGRLKAAATKAAERLNAEGVKYLAVVGDDKKFKHGQAVFKYKHIGMGYYDTDFGEYAGHLRKVGRKWVLNSNPPPIDY
jgi:hypothetical protein